MKREVLARNDNQLRNNWVFVEHNPKSNKYWIVTQENRQGAKEIFHEISKETALNLQAVYENEGEWKYMKECDKILGMMY